MRKNKHQKLADLMNEMLIGLEEQKQKVAAKMNRVQFHFFERYCLLGSPQINEATLNSMSYSHCIGLRHFAVDPILKEKCRELPILGASIKRDLFFQSECRQSSGEGAWVVPMGVKTILPDDNKEKLDNAGKMALLYCPDHNERDHYLDWFEEENAADSLTHQMRSAMFYEAEKAHIRNNIESDPIPLFKEAVAEWQDDPDNSDVVAAQPKYLERLKFVPKKGMTLANALETVWSSKKQRKDRHRDGLRKRYEQKLVDQIFNGIPNKRRESYLSLWEYRFLEKKGSNRSKHTGRWQQCQGIDRYTASDLIRYFVDKFISDSTQKKYGEIACILWLGIWFAQEGEGGCPTLKSIINLTCDQVASDNRWICIDQCEVMLSRGIHKFLCCLQGEGKGLRKRRLFQHVNIKRLERELEEASKELFGNKSAPILPGAFLVSPHPYPGQRIPGSQRKAMRNIEPVVPYRYTRHKVLAALKDSQRALNRK